MTPSTPSSRDTGVRSQRDALRKAQREAEAAEAKVSELESQIATLTTSLADPELYTTTGGAASATRMGVELDKAKAELERALEVWARATEQAESLTSSDAT